MDDVRWCNWTNKVIIVDRDFRWNKSINQKTETSSYIRCVIFLEKTVQVVV